MGSADAPRRRLVIPSAHLLRHFRREDDGEVHLPGLLQTGGGALADQLVDAAQRIARNGMIPLPRRRAASRAEAR